MLRFSVCLETIFDALPFPERIAQAGACGASAVEFWTWQDKDLDGIARAKETVGVDVAAFGALSRTPPNDASVRDEAINEVRLAIEAARQIGATGLILHGGQERPGVARAEQLDAVAALLAATAPDAAARHITLLLEPRNARLDCPGTLLSTTADTIAIIEKVHEPNVKMLFDIYHQYVTEGSVLASIESHIARIGHFHVADVPGRGEPGTGALDFVSIFKLIDSLGYDGYLGLEFHPSKDPAEAVRSVVDLV